MGFTPPAPASTANTTTTNDLEPMPVSAAEAIKDLEKKLQVGIRKVALVGQNLVRHQAVLGFLKTQMSRQGGETHEQMALNIARSHGRGLYLPAK